MRFLTGCVIYDRRGRIIGNGWSHMSETTLTQAYSVHAEIHALLRTPRHLLNGAIACVATISRKSGNLATSSKPCTVCAGALYAAGIEKVYYTTSSGLEEMILNEDTFEDLKVYHVLPRHKH